MNAANKSTSQAHFDQIAENYDHWKQKNSYYQDELQRFFQQLVKPNTNVLEIGCGTGQVIGSLNIASGKGTDISAGMIEIAKKHYSDRPNLTFTTEDILQNHGPLNYDYILIPDVIGHIEKLSPFIGHISNITKPGTTIIVTTANHRWQPILHLAEKLKLKTPEGPHWWLTETDYESIFRQAGLKIVKRGYRFLVPKKVFGAEWINRHFYKNHQLAKLGLGVWWVLEK